MTYPVMYLLDPPPRTRGSTLSVLCWRDVLASIQWLLGTKVAASLRPTQITLQGLLEDLPAWAPSGSFFPSFPFPGVVPAGTLCLMNFLPWNPICGYQFFAFLHTALGSTEGQSPVSHQTSRSLRKLGSRTRGSLKVNFRKIPSICYYLLYLFSYLFSLPCIVSHGP